MVDRVVMALARVYVGLVYVFIFLPLALVVIISLSADRFLNFPPSGLSFQWYRELAANGSFLSAAGNSLIIATGVVVLSLALALPSALALARTDFPGRTAIQTFLLSPLILPTIVLGLAILLVLTRIRLTATYPGLILAHLTITLPFAVRILTTSLSTLPADIESAAATLGASPLQVFLRVTLPMMREGLVASAALCFILSFDETVISLFIVGPRLTTLPVAIYRYVFERTDPLVAAVAVVLIAISFLIILLLERTIGFMRAIGR